MTNKEKFLAGQWFKYGDSPFAFSLLDHGFKGKAIYSNPLTADNSRTIFDPSIEAYIDTNTYEDYVLVWNTMFHETNHMTLNFKDMNFDLAINNK